MLILEGNVVQEEIEAQLMHNEVKYKMQHL
jgi:hypothetical protein